LIKELFSIVTSWTAWLELNNLAGKTVISIYKYSCDVSGETGQSKVGIEMKSIQWLKVTEW